MEFSDALSFPGIRWVFSDIESDLMLLSSNVDLEFPSSQNWMMVTDSLQLIGDHTCHGGISCSDIERTTTHNPTGKCKYSMTF